MLELELELELTPSEVVLVEVLDDKVPELADGHADFHDELLYPTHSRHLAQANHQ